MQNKDQQWLAAFVSKDPADLEAHNEHWVKILASPDTLNRTIVLGDVVIGHIARYYMDSVPQITYWISAEHSGQGHGTAALANFLTIETRRPLQARTAFDNNPSARVLENNGFKIVGDDRYFSNARNAEIEETIWVLE
jgi:RimJ/RimL family protein N-acetyltransferase